MEKFRLRGVARNLRHAVERLEDITSKYFERFYEPFLLARQVGVIESRDAEAFSSKDLSELTPGEEKLLRKVLKAGDTEKKMALLGLLKWKTRNKVKLREFLVLRSLRNFFDVPVELRELMPQTTAAYDREKRKLYVNPLSNNFGVLPSSKEILAHEQAHTRQPPPPSIMKILLNLNEVEAHLEALRVAERRGPLSVPYLTGTFLRNLYRSITYELLTGSLAPEQHRILLSHALLPIHFYMVLGKETRELRELDDREVVREVEKAYKEYQKLLKSFRKKLGKALELHRDYQARILESKSLDEALNVAEEHFEEMERVVFSQKLPTYFKGVFVWEAARRLQNAIHFKYGEEGVRRYLEFLEKRFWRLVERMRWEYEK